jgi:hypothetical protein|tara:strand:- start:201 stop:362 length:162 start_codon:yes stop_codon:yes gene_type:complete
MDTDARLAVLETRIDAIDQRFNKIDKLLHSILGTLLTGMATGGIALVQMGGAG